MVATEILGSGEVEYGNCTNFAEVRKKEQNEEEGVSDESGNGKVGGEILRCCVTEYELNRCVWFDRSDMESVIGSFNDQNGR